MEPCLMKPERTSSVAPSPNCCCSNHHRAEQIRRRRLPLVMDQQPAFSGRPSLPLRFSGLTGRDPKPPRRRSCRTKQPPSSSPELAADVVEPDALPFSAYGIW